MNDVLRTLKKGEWIRVDWLDANTVKNVPLNESVTNPDYPMHTPGMFEGIVEGKKLSYLAIIIESSEYHKDILLIPLILIINVTKRFSRKALKQSRMVGYTRSVREYE